MGMHNRARRRGFGLGRMAKVAAELTADLEVDPPLALACATCGTALGLDPEDAADGDAGPPICGECNRERSFAAIEELGF